MQKIVYVYIGQFLISEHFYSLILVSAKKLQTDRALVYICQLLSLCDCDQCVIIGAGPCGLRTAVELSFMGARVVLLEKRDAFSRNNVLHLWPFTIHDLRGLGAKKFYGKFCAGSIDHISEFKICSVCLITIAGSNATVFCLQVSVSCSWFCLKLLY